MVQFVVWFLPLLLLGRCSSTVSTSVSTYDDPELVTLVRGTSKTVGRSLVTTPNNGSSVTPLGTDDTALINQGAMDEPWQQFIIGGPMTVNLLGQLMVVSSKLDFSFIDISPDYKFTYMKFPQSFRATLTQISNDGWQAFLAAHSNMNKIQMYMQLIPNHIKTALRILAGTTSTTVITNLLPKTLQEIEKIGKNCVQLSNTTHQTFVTVMSLLGEVISVTEVARGLQETRLRQTEIELNVSRVMQVQLNSLGETIRSHYNEAKQTVQQAQSEYSKALKAIPTGFKALLLDLGRAIVGVISVFGNAISRTLTPSQGGSGSAVADTLNNGQSLAFARLYSDTLDKFSTKVNEFLSSSSSSSNPLEEFDAFKVTFNAYLGSLSSGGTNEMKTKIQSYVQEGISLANEVLQLAKKSIGSNTTVDEATAKSIKEKLTTLVASVKPLVAAAEMSGASPPPAAAGSTGAAVSSTDSSANEKFKAQMSSERLRDAEKRYDTIFAQLKQQQEEMGKLMVKIASLDMNRINYAQIVELLREALHLLAQVREQWNQLVLFFAEIAARAEVALGGTLGPFIEQATQAGSASLTVDDRLFYVELLKSQAIEIHKQSYSLFIMSRTYVDMSQEYIMKRLAGLSKMLTATTNEERTRLLQELTNETKDTQEKVIALVNERKATYTASIAKRQKELDSFIVALGGPDAGNQQLIGEGKTILGLE